MYNIKTQKVVLEFKQDSAVLAMDFNTNVNCPPILVSSNFIGQIFVWSLNEKKLISSIEDAHVGAISFLRFLEADRDE